MTWLLGTASYSAFHPWMGVPVATSLGRHDAFPAAHQADVLKPYGIFRVMDDQPEAERRDAYWNRLTARRGALAARLDDLTARYPGTRLVLLCWCRNPTVCHRRWAAGWIEEHHGLEVPELR